MSNQIRLVTATLRFLKPGLLLHKFIDQGTGAEPVDKVYLNDAGVMVLPAGNFEAMLTNIDIGTSVARIMASRKGGAGGKLGLKDAPQVLSGNILFEETDYPLLGASGAPLVFDGVGSDKACREFTRSVAVKAKGGFSRSMATSVLVPTPLTVRITMRVSDNAYFTAETLRELFEAAGMAVRLGTYRKRFGAFVVDAWEIA